MNHEYGTPKFLSHALVIDLEGGLGSLNSPDTDLISATEVLDPNDDRILSREMDNKRRKK